LQGSRSLCGQWDSKAKEKGDCKRGMGFGGIVYKKTWLREYRKKRGTPFPGESEVVTQRAAKA